MGLYLLYPTMSLSSAYKDLKYKVHNSDGVYSVRMQIEDACIDIKEELTEEIQKERCQEGKDSAISYESDRNLSLLEGKDIAKKVANNQ